MIIKKRVWSAFVADFPGESQLARHAYIGGAENAGVENAGVEKAGVDDTGGKCRSGKSRR